MMMMMMMINNLHSNMYLKNKIFGLSSNKTYSMFALKQKNISTFIANNVGVNTQVDSSTGGVALPQDAFEFNSWFVGFSDAESSFSIVPKQDSKGIINRFSFMFAIGLHLDDIEALNYIQSKLNIGVVRADKNECKFIVTKLEEIHKLISLFDTYNLNTSKYLDYLDFKKAFNLYNNREDNLTEELKNKILDLKNGMNRKRINFKMPEDHKIIVTKSWLLGFIEGEGSFQLWRKDFLAAFSLVLTEVQLPVLEKIKEFLTNNLGFDYNSVFKINNSSVISINHQKARKNSKASVLILIKNIHILNNFLVPYLDEMQFLTKKGKDFKDFKLICRLLYIGAHKNKDIKDLILKLSFTMNDYRLSTNLEPVTLLTDKEIDNLVKASSLVEHLDDGRQRDLCSGKIIHQHSSSIYKVIKPNKKVELKQTLFEAAEIAGVNIKTLSKLLDVENSNTVEVKGNLVKRIAVFYNNKK